MEMPRNCINCPLEYWSDESAVCAPLKRRIFTNRSISRLPNCPLHPLDDNVIHVGDEVRLSGMIGTVINIWTDYTGTTLYDVLRRNGGATAWEAKQCIKTGGHFDEVEALLKKMRGEE